RASDDVLQSSTPENFQALGSAQFHCSASKEFQSADTSFLSFVGDTLAFESKDFSGFHSVRGSASHSTAGFTFHEDGGIGFHSDKASEFQPTLTLGSFLGTGCIFFSSTILYLIGSSQTCGPGTQS